MAAIGGWLEFAGVENDGLENDGLENDWLEQEQTHVLHTLKKHLMCTTCNCLKHKSKDILYPI